MILAPWACGAEPAHLDALTGDGEDQKTRPPGDDVGDEPAAEEQEVAHRPNDGPQRHDDGEVGCSPFEKNAKDDEEDQR